MPLRTIQAKLERSSMRVIISAFCGVLFIVTGMNVWIAQNSLHQTQSQMKHALEAKGKTLVQNNSIALSGMVGDRAILGVQELVRQTVLGDGDVVYGIYTDQLGKSWVNSVEGGDSAHSVAPQMLTDSMSRWAVKQDSLAFRIVNGPAVDVMEFCNPVWIDGERVGVIRYGLSMQSLENASQIAHAANRRALMFTILVLIAMSILVILISLFAIRKQSQRLSAPLIRLRTEAQAISDGDYGNPVDVDSDDEIGALASSFEEMRHKIKQYTDHLEDLVDDKMRQVRDILDNIDQGLFTVNFDGSINAEYSRAAAKMLGRDDLPHSNIQQLLRLSDAESAAWNDWISVVRLRHQQMRWDKLLKIAPCREQVFLGADQSQYVFSFSYQKVFDKEHRLSRLMVLVQDVTEARRVERIVQEEQEKHENEVRTILGIVNNVPEIIRDFFRDVDDRLASIRANLDTLRHASVPLPTSAIALIFRDIHTIKGNASSYGFEYLGKIAHGAEDQLDQLRGINIEQVRDGLIHLHISADEMARERQNIEATSVRLRGGRDSMTVSISERKIDHVQRLAKTLIRETSVREHNPFIALAGACNDLRRVNVTELTGKYAAMVERIAEKLGKHVVFDCGPAKMEVEPTLFVAINDALVHLLRNAVDHGVETPEERERAGKVAMGRIRLQVEEEEDRYVLNVQDDGCGIDVDRVGRIAVDKGLVTAGDYNRMTRRQRLELVFYSGLSTRESVSELSGRGVGMEAAKVVVEKLGGRISIESELGIGTSVHMEIPLSLTLEHSK